MDVNDIFIAENWARGEVLRPKYFYMFVNDIFITENWDGREPLCRKFFVCKLYFYYRELGRAELYRPHFLKWTNIMFLLQDTGKGKNLFTLIYCVFTLNWVGQEFFAPNTLYVCK